MQLALTRPELVQKLIVADMSPRAYTPLHNEIIAALVALDVASFAARTAPPPTSGKSKGAAFMKKAVVLVQMCRIERLSEESRIAVDIILGTTQCVPHAM